MNTHSVSYWLNQSHLGRIVLLGALILLLQIPITSIEKLVNERRSTELSAVQDVQQKWGKSQTIVGPLLIVPYQIKRPWQEPHSDAQQIEYLTKYAVFLPDDLKANSSLRNETRYRGLFKVPLYQADVTLAGQFRKPNFAGWDVDDQDVLWDKVKLVLMVSDARAIQKQAKVTWNHQQYYFEPGTDEIVFNNEGYHVLINGFNALTEDYTFDIKLVLNGSQSLFLSPLGKDTTINIAAPWPDPSFQGKWLPTSREVNTAGFKSEWHIPYLGRNFPQQTRDFKTNYQPIKDALVGVELITPVDNYRMAERSTKYGILFLLLTFLAIWLFELVAKLRVHIMQYLFMGSALCIFYLLELSLSEHIGFYLAYLTATTAIVAMVSAYSYVVLKTGKRAALIGSIVASLYGYLFTLLKEENYSLLIGSIGLFAILAAVMYLTRNIDWFKVTQFTANNENATGITDSAESAL
jgi:inner membrane protein